MEMQQSNQNFNQTQSICFQSGLSTCEINANNISIQQQFESLFNEQFADEQSCIDFVRQTLIQLNKGLTLKLPVLIQILQHANKNILMSRQIRYSLSHFIYNDKQYDEIREKEIFITNYQSQQENYRINEIIFALYQFNKIKVINQNKQYSLIDKIQLFHQKQIKSISKFIIKLINTLLPINENVHLLLLNQPKEVVIPKIIHEFNDILMRKQIQLTFYLIVKKLLSVQQGCRSPFVDQFKYLKNINTEFDVKQFQRFDQLIDQLNKLLKERKVKNLLFGIISNLL